MEKDVTYGDHALAIKEKAFGTTDLTQKLRVGHIVIFTLEGYGN